MIVRARPGHRHQAALAVRSAGGTLGRDLTIVDGFAARLPASAARRLGTDRSIAAITPNRAVRFSSLTSAAVGPLIASNYPTSTGASSVWGKTNSGGEVTVALIDTGVRQVDDLAGRVMAGPDFSAEGDSRTDSYGHGTVMAGIIAGDGTDSAGDLAGAYIGMAPRATVLSVKVAGRNGATDVSTVLAAMQWVGSHAAANHIRAVNISWGTTSDQSPTLDPLNYAVERLWSAGVVVIAAAGNAGPAAGTITKPGDDPMVITAGAYDDRLDAGLTNDLIPAWSSRGPTAAGLVKPDLVAPGRTIVATRSPGSYVDTTFPEARIGSAYIRGSGTSQATAVVTGAVALMFAYRPWLTPDQVKYALTATAQPIAYISPTVQGQGRLWLPTALGLRVRSAPDQHSSATGLGSIEQSRGDRHVETICAGNTTVTRIEGEQDALCLPWNPQQWTTSDAWTSDAWTSDAWTADSWTADSWTADSWTSDFLTAFWGVRTPWWHRVPGEAAEVAPRQLALTTAMAKREDRRR
ncbi:MAG: S8 family serine peptidase [Actinomycetota bacterium]|nr:S8 family serine peptidase [Actinomycetota bacterium]